ncbi:transmembrane secretion effector [Nocardia tenerifensis]|uniref:Transmembrane secretion effector n=1 Tax=Nocardia tenerifensis TaxID=228006 RepID=A0A318JY46_9NOCA|nr:MFS transporter [Nocardia tenerifensis]PXX58776.1 transmembrane secretion effector [Nocardia tenerifensis]
MNSIRNTAPRSRRSDNGVLGNRAFAFLWLGLVVSVLGDAFYRVALTLTVAKAGPTGLIGLGVALALPTAAIGLFAGVLIDRSDRVRLLIGTDLVRCAIVAVLGLLLLGGRTSLTGTLFLATLLAFVSVVFMPAFQTLLPEVGGNDRTRIIAMDAWILGALSVVGVLGPALAGVLLRYVDGAVLMFLDAATFGFSALMIFGARVRAPMPSDPAPGAGRLEAVGAGVRFLMKHPVLGPCFQTFPFMDFAFNSIPFVLPLLLGTGGPARYGAQLAALAVGRVAGMTLLNKTALQRHRGAVLRANFLAQGAGILLFAACATSWVGLIPLALTGIPAGAAQVAMSSYIQLEVAPELRGRVFAALISMVTWLAPFGPIVFVALAGWAGPTLSLAAIAAVLLAGGARLLLCRPLAAVA